MSFKHQSVNVHNFAMVPKADIPRSSFRMQKMLKTTFGAANLIPIMVEEVLPGDTFSVHMTAFCRLATPIVPIMDNIHLETFFFFVPNRLVWKNWQRFMGEQDLPTDSISFTIPQIVSPVGGYPICSLYDYMGLPTVGQVGGANTITHSALPLRCYNLIWNQWFRDENLQDSVNISAAGVSWTLASDGPDNQNLFVLKPRGKRHDYFTSCLPFVQKGTAISLPLGSTAPVVSDGSSTVWYNPAQTRTGFLTWQNAANAPVWSNSSAGSGNTNFGVAGTTTTGLRVDLASATASTINAIRLAFQTQKLLERDARGGTRYTELNRQHFGVTSPDSRMMRPEYLGGGHSGINIHPVEQTTPTGIAGTTTPLGALSAFGTALGTHGFSQSFTEHGHVIGLASVRNDITYQQGMRKMWSRSTRYDFYFPVFAALGEQAVLNREIYCDGSANDALVFGYQERWAEYRYNPSTITGLFRSTSTGTLDYWHLAEKFTALPTLNATFIQDPSRTVLQRDLAAGALADNAQILMDAFFDIKAARPLPMYSVPGLVDHF